MTDSTERLVNLAMLFATSRASVTAEQIRSEVEGYSTDQDDAAFLRMFERDKKALRAAAFIIEADAEGSYRLDAGATFTTALDISADEAAAVRIAGLALLQDPSFPFAADARLALAKLAVSARSTSVPLRARLVDESASTQGQAVATLNEALRARKTARFGYTNARGDDRDHVLEPYGLFLRDGRWYLVGRDADLGETRVYAITRMSRLEINSARPGTPDFELPDSFDVASFIRLPFQYGAEETGVVLRFAPGESWRAPALVGHAGRLETEGESVLWRVVVRDRRQLMRWVVENGPGISIVDPPDLAEDFRALLEGVAAAHG